MEKNRLYRVDRETRLGSHYGVEGRLFDKTEEGEVEIRKRRLLIVIKERLEQPRVCHCPFTEVCSDQKYY